MANRSGPPNVPLVVDDTLDAVVAARRVTTPQGWVLPVGDVRKVEGKTAVFGPHEGPFEPTPVEAVVNEKLRHDTERNHTDGCGEGKQHHQCDPADVVRRDRQDIPDQEARISGESAAA